MEDHQINLWNKELHNIIRALDKDPLNSDLINKRMVLYRNIKYRTTELLNNNVISIEVKGEKMKNDQKVEESKGLIDQLVAKKFTWREMSKILSSAYTIARIKAKNDVPDPDFNKKPEMEPEVPEPIEPETAEPVIDVIDADEPAVEDKFCSPEDAKKAEEQADGRNI